MLKQILLTGINYTNALWNIALEKYLISSFIRLCFFHPKQSQKSRSILEDGSRFWGLLRKGETCIIAKFQRTDLVICSHSRERKTLSYSQINMVCNIPFHTSLTMIEFQLDFDENGRSFLETKASWLPTQGQ